MKNVRLEGLGNNQKDINSLTLVNLSDRHVFEDITVVNSQDDGIEIFGGSVNMKNVTIHDALDDYFDTDHGHTGTITNLKLYQSSKYVGKSLIECGKSKGITKTKFVNVTVNNLLDACSYVNNGSDNTFNIKKGSQVEINGKLLTEPHNELPELEYILDAKMCDIPRDGILDKIYIFRNNEFDSAKLYKKDLIKKEGTLGSILIIGNSDNNYGNFTDFKQIGGLESIPPANKTVKHVMKNVTLNGLGDNDKDINALTLVNLDNSHTFEDITVINSQDDGIEIFGGSVDMKNITVQDALDDYFDTDQGHSGKIFNLNLVQTDKNKGKSLIECGNKGTTNTQFLLVTYNGGYDTSTYNNNGGDKNINIKQKNNNTSILINGETLVDSRNNLPKPFVMDAKMSDIPSDGVLDKIYIFRDNQFKNSKETTLLRKNNTFGSILIIGFDKSYGDFTDFDQIPGLEKISPAKFYVKHEMKNVTLEGLGSNEKDINALTLVNLDNTNVFENIKVINSQDDGIEIFGGSVNMNNITVQDALDDYFDTDHGHDGKITNLNLEQRDKGKGKSLIECGNSNGSTRTTFENVTFNNSTDTSSYNNNGKDKNFNVKKGSYIIINNKIHLEASNNF